MNRAERRYHKQRVKQRARKIARINHGYLETTHPEILDSYEKNYEIIAENLKECQHPGCGNVRRNPWEKDKRTKQEIAADMQLEEYRA